MYMITIKCKQFATLIIFTCKLNTFCVFVKFRNELVGEVGDIEVLHVLSKRSRNVELLL